MVYGGRTSTARFGSGTRSSPQKSDNLPGKMYSVNSRPRSKAMSYSQVHTTIWYITLIKLYENGISIYYQIHNIHALVYIYIYTLHIYISICT